MTSSDNPDHGDDGRAGRLREVEEDVGRLLGSYLEPIGDGFEVEGGFGDEGVVTGSSSRGRFTFVRWRWRGRHTGAVSRFDGEAPDESRHYFSMAKGTGNEVTVEGLTVLEERDGEDGTFARRFVDWLSVYSQMGIISPGRPVGRSSTELRDPPDRRELPPRVDPSTQAEQEQPAAKTAPPAS
jgi:hypothetical protein